MRKIKLPHRQELARAHRFVLFTEGAVTEPAYFRALASRLKVSLIVQAAGLYVDDLLKRAAAYQADKRFDPSLDSLWIVIDQDQLTSQEIADRQVSAESNGVNLVYSCPCFELWLLLHFGSSSHPVTTAPMSPAECAQFLERAMGSRYVKTSRNTIEKIAALSVENAIARSIQLSQIQHQINGDNPISTVHRLVRRMLDSSTGSGYSV